MGILRGGCVSRSPVAGGIHGMAHGARQHSAKDVLRRLYAVIAWPLVLALAGCCVPAPGAEKYFDRENPLGALKGFAYAVEAEQWDYAYQSLTEGTREEIGRLKFRVAIKFLNDPIGDVSIYTLLTNVFRWAPLWANRHHARVRIVSSGTRPDGRLVVRALDVVLTLEDGEWRLDLLATAEGLAARSERRQHGPLVVRRLDHLAKLFRDFG